MSTAADFEAAAAHAASPACTGASNDQKIRLYGLFKQATVGDCETAQPGILDQKGRAKWAAWSALKGKAAEAAMEEYVMKVETLAEQE